MGQVTESLIDILHTLREVLDVEKRGEGSVMVSVVPLGFL